jgi:hypothetical protein
VDSVTPDGPRRAPIRWHVATVRDARAESPTARTLVLDVPAGPDTSPASTSTFV